MGAPQRVPKPQMFHLAHGTASHFVLPPCARKFIITARVMTGIMWKQVGSSNNLDSRNNSSNSGNSKNGNNNHLC